MLRLVLNLFLGCNATRLDVAFVVDNTGNISHSDWSDIYSFIDSMATRLNVGMDRSQIALITNSGIAYDLNSHGSIEEILTTNSNFRNNSLQNASDVLWDLSVTLKMLRTNVFSSIGGDRPDVPNVVIAVTNQKSMSESAIYESVVTRNAGIMIFVVGISQVYDAQFDGFLSLISSPPNVQNDTFYRLATYSELTLQSFVDDLVNRLQIFSQLYICMYI